MISDEIYCETEDVKTTLRTHQLKRTVRALLRHHSARTGYFPMPLDGPNGHAPLPPVVPTTEEIIYGNIQHFFLLTHK